MKLCNYYVSLRSNDTCEFSSLWQDDQYKNIEEKPYDLSLLQKTGIKYLNITGGEPLLREDLPQVLKSARELGFHITLTTNGILYSEKANQLNGLVDKLYFFLDYPIAEEHDRSRGAECFHQVVQNIKFAREIGERPIIKFTMTRDSVRFLPEMVELSERLAVPVYLSPVYDFHGTQGFERATLPHIRYYARKKNVLLDLAVLGFVRAGGNNVLFPRCRARETTVTILPNGSRVSPCFFNQCGRQGREEICSSCMRWPYMLPSFAKGIDKYRLMNAYSRADAWRKGVKT